MDDVLECTAVRHILVVEDIENNLKLIRAFLKDTCWQLITAQNGLEALDYYQKESVDLILMDMQMPVMDGYTATTLIRQKETCENLPRVPIVALTAHAFTEDVEKCLAIGCDAYLSKPIRKDKLLETIRNMLNAFSNCSMTQQSVKETPQTDSGFQALTEEEFGDDDKIIVSVDFDLIALIPDFLKSIWDQVSSLSELLNDGDYAEIQRIGHAIKGVGGGYGFQKITDIGAVIEQAAKTGAHDDIEHGIFDLKQFLSQVQIISK
jgi:CheY-like chemotaxis protein/HPt (histidine-containing phosphotransfer) domain-containing protein